MSRIRTLIADDEPLAREGIALLLAQDPEMEVVGLCGDGQTALEEIRRQQPDLAFVDIHMPRLNGLDAIEQLPAADRPAIVFVTAHHQYAVRAFGACAVDYLLKPYRDDRFQAALARAKEHVRRVRGTGRPPPAPALGAAQGAERARPDAADRLVFKVGSDFVFLNPDELIWIEAQGNFVKLGVVGQTLLAREALQSVEERLEAGPFARVHRSFLLNTRHIRRIEPVLYGDYRVLMSDGTKIRLSRSYRDRLKALLPPSLA
jgi:two-component system, LytTR family, response regulator